MWPFRDPFKGKGEIIVAYPDKVVWGLFDDDGEIIATCTQTFVEPIIESNKRALNDSAGQRWGDGKIVASIPMDVYFDKLLPAKKAGDDAYIRRFLNDIDNRHFRRFGGRV